LNDGSQGNIQSGNVGLLIRDNDINDKGFIKTNTESNKILIKAP